LVILFGLFSAVSSSAATKKALTVTEGNQKYMGTLFIPKSPKKNIPLVVVAPEWWGKNDYVDRRAKQVADELGAVALAVDFYGDDKVVKTPAEAGNLAREFYKNPEKGVTILNAFLTAAPAALTAAKVNVDLNKVMAIGYCFGGTQVLNLVRSGKMPKDQKLAGVVSFHGGLSSSLHASAPITAKLLVLHGAADTMVKPEDVENFKKEMAQAKADMTFIAYPGAIHAFTNPNATEIGKKYGIAVAYNESADKKSWAEFKKFYGTITGK
jgi:dienelactone hydrolase